MSNPSQLTTDHTAHGTLKVHFDASCNATLRLVLMEDSSLFIEADPAEADVVLFGTDEILVIRNSALYKAHRAKSLCITESDIPTFRLPGLYAANQKGILTRRRTKTVNYFLSERNRPNLEVKRLIGQPVEKRYLYSFMGGTNSWARRRLFGALQSREDTLVESTDAYNHWADDGQTQQQRASQMQLRYAQVMAASKFTLCPRGCGLSSYRLFESMSLGVVPVVISDKWRPVEGIDWSFAVIIRERDIADADRIMRGYEGEWQARGLQGQATYRALLQPTVVARMVHQQLGEVLASYSPAREAVAAIAAEARAASREGYWATYAVLKKVALKMSSITGVAIPVKMRKPGGEVPPQTNLGVGTPRV